MDVNGLSQFASQASINSGLANSLTSSTAASSYSSSLDSLLTSSQSALSAQNDYKNSVLYGSNSGSQTNAYGKNTATAADNTTYSYLTDLKSTSSDALTSLNSLLGNGKSSDFSQTSAASSDTASVTVGSVDPYSGINGQITTETVGVSQVAAAQTNTGTTTNSVGMDYTPSSDYQIQLTDASGNNTQVSFSTDANDTNFSTQQKMADAINQSNSGVTATVNFDNTTHTSSLSLASTDTGSTTGFSVSDVVGNAVATSGTGTMTSAGQDAIYTENGVSNTSSSNNINLMSGANITLVKATTSDVTISGAADSSKAVNDINSMVKSFNSLLSTASGNSGDRSAMLLSNQLSGASNVFSGDLSKIGISVGQDGSLTVDQDKLKTASTDGSLQKFVQGDNTSAGGGGYNYGFADRLKSIASSINNDPTNYASMSAMTSLNNSTLSSSYSFSQLTGTGMMFNAAI